MRILQVVTLMSPDGAYGGPVRVALNQARELRSRSHEVTVAAAASGYRQLPTEMDGVPVQLFPRATAVPGTGFAGIYAKGMAGWLHKKIPAVDVVHVHLARDLVTLPAARLVLQQKAPLVVQPHGMIDPTERLLARPLDRFMTKPVLRQADSVFFLTRREADDLTEVAGPGLSLRELHNGTPTQPGSTAAPEGEPEVLYLARLHARKRPELFVQMAHSLLREGLAARFTLVGPDEGMGQEVDRLITDGDHGGRITRESAVTPELAAQRMSRAKIFVLPSIDEPYPMSVLEAMSLGLPAVVTQSCGLARLIDETGSGLVVGPDLASLTNAVGGLLREPARAQEMGARAKAVARERLSMSSVAQILEQTYDEARHT